VLAPALGSEIVLLGDRAEAASIRRMPPPFETVVVPE